MESKVEGPEGPWGDLPDEPSRPERPERGGTDWMMLAVAAMYILVGAWVMTQGVAIMADAWVDGKRRGT